MTNAAVDLIVVVVAILVLLVGMVTVVPLAARGLARDHEVLERNRSDRRAVREERKRADAPPRS